jgi:hypothetical protein
MIAVPRSALEALVGQDSTVLRTKKSGRCRLCGERVPYNDFHAQDCPVFILHWYVKSVECDACTGKGVVYRYTNGETSKPDQALKGDRTLDFCPTCSICDGRGRYLR